MKSKTFPAAAVICFFLIQAACKNPSPGKAAENTSTDTSDKFADNIRRTPFLSPEEERKSFKLPEGFEATLFAAEPDISKPINMEFDAKGRLWVTCTTEYPMPARGRKGKDRIMILEDTDGDGKADKFTPFADTLNIPIGMTPVHNGAIAYSIPNIYKFIDKDGDGKADESIKLVGPFQYEDTHGMVNNLIRGYDGWIHACHGYANSSTVAGKDGDSITMHSGNTFRFREDGSRVEATTFGRVNPFGYCYDDWGYLYSLDCHTKPIYQLIHNATYPGQGVREPSIGWAPAMMDYEFGSTANSGMVYYTGTEFPDAFKHNFYSGNVVTCRINRNTMSLHGSTPEAKREEDFLISEDPWFRPVDLKTGPDGAIYVADFYNKIIGHYEVPKDNPERDRTSGRIWKITYKGSNAKFIATDWSKNTLGQLIKALNYQQLNIRMMIANLIVDDYAQKAIEPVKQMMDNASTDSRSFIQGLWILYRLNALPEQLIEKALRSSDPMVQVHGLRVLAELKSLTAAQRDLAFGLINNKNPQVQRFTVELLGLFPDYKYLQPLLDLYTKTDARDTHLKYTMALSIRNHLRNAGIMQRVAAQKWSDERLSTLVFIMPEVPSKAAAIFSFNYLKSHELKGKQLENNLKYLSRFATPEQADVIMTLTRQRVGGDTATEYKLFKAVSDGLAERGGVQSLKYKQWDARMDKLGLKPVQTAAAVTAEISPEERKKLIKERIAAYDPTSVTTEHGKEVFTTNCTMCHRIGNNEGGTIAPQLSGIGTWGQRALTEKILNPNGSISTAYRVFNITLKDGKKLSGLFRREEGKVQVFANFAGQEFTVPKTDIREQVASKYTLMPDNFRNTIAKKDFDALLKYLLSIKEK